MENKSRIFISLALVLLIALNIYQYRQHQLQAEQTGAYIQMTTLDALYMSSRNLVWDYYGHHPQLRQVVSEDIETVSACHIFVYRGNGLFSNLRNYVLQIRNSLEDFQDALEKGSAEEINSSQAQVAETMKGVRDALEKTEADIEALDMEIEVLDRAWYDAYWKESGPVYEILSKHFPTLEIEEL